MSLIAPPVGTATTLAAGRQRVVRHRLATRQYAERVRAALTSRRGRARAHGCARPRAPIARSRSRPRALLTRLRHGPIVVIDMHEALAEECCALMRADARQTRSVCNAASSKAILRGCNNALLAPVGVIAAAHLAAIGVASPDVRRGLHDERYEGREDDRSLNELLGGLREKHSRRHAAVAVREGRSLLQLRGLVWLVHVAPVGLVPGEHHEAAVRDLQMPALP